MPEDLQGPHSETPQPPEGQPLVVVVTKIEKRKRKLHHLLFLILAWIIGCAVTLGLAIGLFIQLPVFKRIVVNELVKTVETSTNGMGT